MHGRATYPPLSFRARSFIASRCVRDSAATRAPSRFPQPDPAGGGAGGGGGGGGGSGEGRGVPADRSRRGRPSIAQLDYRANDRGVAIAIGEKKRRSPTDSEASLPSLPSPSLPHSLFSCHLSAPAILYRPLAARTGRGLMEIYDSHLIGFNVPRISSSRGSASSDFLRAVWLLQGSNDLGD
jgi:hypothetical protein